MNSPVPTAAATPASAQAPAGLEPLRPPLGAAAPWLQRALAPAAQALAGRPVLVLGLGASGLALARWCALAGAHVTVADSRPSAPQAATLAAELPQVQLRLGTRFDASLYAAAPWALVCRSPGILPSDMAELSAAAQSAGTAIVGELGLFGQALQALGGAAEVAASAHVARAGRGRGEESEPATDEPRPCPARANAPAQNSATASYRPHVLAITGTNGKTTTTALTAHLLQAAGWDVAVAGNIGPNLLDVLRQRLQAQHLHELPQAWVLELSSFQLDAVEGFEASAATVLNLSEDHLDWHGTMAAYGAAKARIFGQRALMLLNRDDATVMSWCPAPVHAATAQAAPASRRRAPEPPPRPYQTFGTDEPQRPGDWGLQSVNGLTWLVRALADDAHALAPRRRPGANATADAAAHAAATPRLQLLMPAEALRIRGRHNASNALAALALASAAGAELAPLLHGLRDYRGEPHRVEPVGIVAEVEYIDDSKGTNVGATLAALNGLGVERKLVLILGGDGKGQHFAPLAPGVARYARAVALIGRDAATIEAELADCGVPLQRCASLPEAVRWCAAQAQPGDAVLLSPACASLDMFRDYAHRAQVFVATVRELQQEGGTPA
jgi:UDP-N-acetylmuramoylalanine--D-glutamate ligase